MDAHVANEAEIREESLILEHMDIERKLLQEKRDFLVHRIAANEAVC